MRVVQETGSPWALPLVVVLAFAGAGISLMLTRYHLSQGRNPGAVFELVCGKEGGGCTDVLASSWAVLPGGIPLAAAGLIYFGSLGLWYLIAGPANRRGRTWQALPLGLNVLGVVVSVFLFAVMLTRIHAVCWWCTFSHLINFALLYFAWKLWPKGEPDPAEPAHPDRRLGLASLLLMIALAVIIVQRVAVARARIDAGQANEYARRYSEDVDLQRYLQQRQAAVAVPLRPDDPVRGNPAAPHTVMIFSDFQCPACRALASFVESEILPRFGERIKIAYKHFPLEPECNPNVTRTVHPDACQASYAAEAARQAGGSEAFWRMHDLLFGQQDLLPQAPWADLGSRAGLDGAALAQQVAASFGKERIQEDAALGQRLQVRSTPTVFVDGQPMQDWRRLDIWEAVLK